jgi:hypothetical protein
MSLNGFCVEDGLMKKLVFERVLKGIRSLFNEAEGIVVLSLHEILILSLHDN